MGDQDARQRFIEYEKRRKDDTKPKRALLFGSFAFRNKKDATEADLHADAYRGPNLSEAEKAALLEPSLSVATVVEAEIVAETYHSDEDETQGVIETHSVDEGSLRGKSHNPTPTLTRLGRIFTR